MKDFKHLNSTFAPLNYAFVHLLISILNCPCCWSRTFELKVCCNGKMNTSQLIPHGSGFVLDNEDRSITRSDLYFKELFHRCGLHLYTLKVNFIYCIGKPKWGVETCLKCYYSLLFLFLFLDNSLKAREVYDSSCLTQLLKRVLTIITYVRLILQIVGVFYFHSFSTSVTF